MNGSKFIKNKKILSVIIIIILLLIVGIGIVYSMRNVIINQIAINNYVEPFDDELDDARYSTYIVGEDIDPGLYTATYKYSKNLRLVSKLLSDSESSTTIGVKIYKAKQNMEIKVKMYSGSDYHNLYLEDGDRIEIYTFAEQGNTWLPNLVEQDSVVEYSSSKQLAGFYMLSDDNVAGYDDNFGSSFNILYQYKDGAYSPRMFMPYADFEDDVVASDGDIIYLESETLINAMSS